MQLIFERGSRDEPVGHALVYFRAEDGTILATYVTVPPIAFDLSKFVPQFLSGMFQDMEMPDGVVATPVPPVPEEVAGVDYLRSLADRRADDLVFAGGTSRSDPMRLVAEAQEAAREYGELYGNATGVGAPAPQVEADVERFKFEGMTEEERLNELTRLTGRVRDALRDGTADEQVQRDMQSLALTLPAKYRAERLVRAAETPGDRGERLASLYLQRAYKLYREEYLDLERIDREIDALSQ
jgi:hypothetical protein